MTKRQLAQHVFLTGTRPGGYEIVVKPHKQTGRALHLHGTYINDYRLGIAMVRAIREELRA
jgi:hypothetical protein